MHFATCRVLQECAAAQAPGGLRSPHPGLRFVGGYSAIWWLEGNPTAAAQEGPPTCLYLRSREPGLSRSLGRAWTFGNVLKLRASGMGIQDTGSGR